MEGENEMIPMGGEDEVEGPDVPPTVKERNAAQQHVSRLLDKLDVDNRVQIALLVQEAGGQ